MLGIHVQLGCICFPGLALQVEASQYARSSALLCLTEATSLRGLTLMCAAA